MVCNISGGWISGIRGPGCSLISEGYHNGDVEAIWALGEGRRGEGSSQLQTWI